MASMNMNLLIYHVTGVALMRFKAMKPIVLPLLRMFTYPCQEVGLEGRKVYAPLNQKVLYTLEACFHCGGQISVRVIPIGW